MSKAKQPDLTTTGGRLIAERQRLALPSQDMAAIAGVDHAQWLAWEASTVSAATAALTAVESVGVDVQFVVTGKRIAERLAGVTAEEALSILPLTERHRLLLALLAAELRR